MRFAKEAWPFVVPVTLLALLLLALGLPWSASLVALLALATLLFFRVPRLEEPGDAAATVAPAFGKILAVDEIEDPEIGPGRFRRIVTFLSVFDVHVQRCPVAGTVVRRRATSGRKVAAFRGEADRVNERQLTVIETADGRLVGVRQIVGLVARRIVTDLEEGDGVQRGQRLGLIKFGSRVDLLLSGDVEILVREGDRLRGGETPVARLRPSRTD